jgi:hypothetical protein
MRTVTDHHQYVSVKSLNNETEVEAETVSLQEQSAEDNNKDATGGLRKLHNDLLCNWYSLTIITKPITSRKVTKTVTSYSWGEKKKTLTMFW